MNRLTAAEVGDAQWNAFVDACDQGWISHRTESRPLRRTSEDCSFALCADGAIQALAVFSAYPYVKGRILLGSGPIYLDGGSRRCVKEMRQSIASVAAAKGCHAVHIAHPEIAPGFFGKGPHDTGLLELGASFDLYWGDSDFRQPGFRNVISLRTGGNIEASFSQGHRRALRRAQKEGLDFCLLSRPDEGDWQRFEAVHLSTAQRNRIGAYSDEYLTGIRNLVTGGLARLAVVTKDKEPVAAAVIDTYKSRATYLVGGTAPDALSSGAFVYLLWSAIRSLREDGYDYFDVGPTFPNLRGKMGDIGEFKRRFGGLRQPMLCGEIVIDEDAYIRHILKPRLDRRFNWRARIRPFVPQSVRSVIKSLIRK